MVNWPLSGSGPNQTSDHANVLKVCLDELQYLAVVLFANIVTASNF